MTDTVRVLHVTFNMGIGGTEQVIRQLITGLDSEKVTSEILCIDGQVGAIGEQLRESGIPIVAVQRRPGFDRSLIRIIRTRLRKGHFDVVHCHQYTPWVYGWFAALGLPVSVVFTEHGRFYPDRYRYKAALVNQAMARTSRAMVAISDATRQALARYEFLPRSRIRVVYNGIAALQPDHDRVAALRAELGIPEEAFVMGTVSRMDPVKNQSMMLRAFHRFLQQCPEGWLLVVGDGAERESLQFLAGELGISERVTFTGSVSQPANHMALMEVFLLSSFTEGTSMTLLEAMSLGIPAVATDVGGNPEIVREGINGMLVPVDDEQAFAEAMIGLWQEPETRSQLGQGARTRFDERFSREVMVNAYQEIYREAAHKES
ncbi:glycosyltransferase [Marinobacter persicus]|uniref:Glycosyltransferase involved in cell wall biosynthesis n=1 Tax=Marinobacter persicus TaxID=930118 RepID=A0A2S6G952_9GAMM|nr:glycosyltransferase [Marinobacter persicus]PPK52728.1 glycosyltransferase involved in cell wall biosynthesis [Marinobacter persicus]PPK55726.1 glycosyltransferase involved in cell wall biosynthesis [Marinobacter persicus]PPK59239.1 glycosyltransferase involved in cell wall biosynthesis [Marinobacter persicus]